MAVRTAEKAAEAVKTVRAEDTTQAKENAQGVVQNAAEQKKLVYVGPTLPRGQLKTNSIFIGTQQEIEQEQAQAIQKYPAVKNLLVPVTSLATAKAKTQTAGNMLYQWCAEITSQIIDEMSKESEV